MIQRKTKSYMIFSVFNFVVLTFSAILCIFPVLHILAVSLSEAGPAAANQIVLIPKGFNIQSYLLITQRMDFLLSFWVSIRRVLLGVVINTIFTVLLAYPLSKSNREFRGRTIYTWMLIFVMIFNGGIVPNFILINNLGLMDSIWALVLPTAVPIFNVILVMNFIKQLPKDIEEAGFIDGANYFQSLISLILPLSKPVIATVTLFSFLNHWNAWFDGLIYNNNSKNYPLQTFMYTVVSNRDVTNLDQATAYAEVNSATLQSAQLFVSLIPILIIYPFLQKHFTKGLTIGAVKG